MANDKLGYYSDLGVSQSASLDEIRAVYRALAKIYHPDVNKDKAAVEKFRRITTAYEVLSDQTKRVAYDSSEQTSAQTQTAPSKQPTQEKQFPIVACSICKKPTAQPRFIVFRYVVSAIVTTWVTPKAGVFCSSCATKQAVRSTLISAAFGWWGLPWGPIYTVVHGLKNAFGGQANRGIDEQLMWQNTIAFGRRGNVDLAGTLASHLINASDRDLGEAAWHLKTAIEADGHKIRPFKSAWRFNYGNAFRQLASLAVVPLVTGAVAYGIFDTSNRSTASDGRPKLNFDDLPSEKSIASIPKPALDFSENGTPVNQCINPPHNGQVLLKRIALSKGGHRLTIKNGTSGDAIIKVRNEFGNHTQVSFFVANNSIASISGLPDGRYKIQFATGDALLANCKAFVTPNASEFNSTETFSTTYTSTQIISLELELTLYAVSGGNARTSNVDAASFQSD